MQIVIDTPAVTIRYHNTAFLIENAEGLQRTVSPDKISSIAIKTSDCLVSSLAVLVAAEKKIPILFFGRYGAVTASLRSPHFSGLSDLRRRQALFIAHPEAAKWIISLFGIKMEGQLAVLSYLRQAQPDFDKDIQYTIDKMQQISLRFAALKTDEPFLPTGELASHLMGIEGSIAREYWRMLSQIMPDAWRFEGRSRQPALDAFNAVLNYLYGMTYPVVESALFSAGLDPYIGVLHADDYDSPALAFDCIEPFRPWVDELVLTQFLTGQVYADMFIVEAETGAWSLSGVGKRFWIPLYNDYLKSPCYFRNKRVLRETHIYRFAGDLSNMLKALEL